MSQKGYKYEILDFLLKKRMHIRALAKAIKTNQTTIARKVKELEKNNVVDYNLEGKNKVYFIKKTIEAQEHVKIMEHYKLLKTLRKESSLKIIVKEIKDNKKIKLAILFGSYAKGLSTKNSDIDIYIETKNRNLKKELEKIDSRLSIKIGSYDKKSLLISEIEGNHVTIKGVERFYEKNKFFS